MSLEFFEKEQIEIFIDTTTGESFATISGYARMSSKDKSTISRRLQGVASNKTKNAEVVTPGGLQAVALINEDLISEWLPKDNPEMATKLLKFGVRGFLHRLAGYQVTSTAIKSKSKIELIIESAQQLLEIEQRVSKNEEAIATVATEVKSIQDRAFAAAAELKALPQSGKEIPSRTIRNNINARIRAFCHATGIRHGDAWGDLYREFRDRYHIDLKVRASNGKSAPLDIAESLDLIDDLYAIACELFKLEGE